MLFDLNYDASEMVVATTVNATQNEDNTNEQQNYEL
jgi:hypothetical protein